MRCISPAKLNLFLHVIGRRAEDAYHLLQSVFVRISLYDTMEFHLRNDNHVVRHGFDAVSYENDLCIKAAKALRDYSKNKVKNDAPGIDIHLKKRIPMAAGLGGASSNAATTLMALNQLWKLNYPREDLLPIAQNLGADVPFFLYEQNAFVEGVGELVRPITIPHYYFVVIKPNQSSITAHAFAQANITQQQHSAPIHTQKAIIQAIDTANNALQASFLIRHPDIAAWHQQYPNFVLTGSGSAFFARFDDKHAQYACYQNVRIPKGWQIFLCEMIT